MDPLALLESYGMLGLFLLAFLSSTIFFPFPFDLVVAALAMKFDVLQVVIVATVGSYLGALVNYALGMLGTKGLSVLGKKYARARKFDERIRAMRKIIRKWGALGVFVIFALPFLLPVDVVAVAVGFLRMPVLLFSAVVLPARLLRYSFIASVPNLFSGLVG